MRLAVSAAALDRLLARTAFTRAYGFRVAELGAGECLIEVPFHSRFERPGGIVSGQVFMTAADVAMWLAIKTVLGRRDGSVTAGMTTTFLRPVRRRAFRCRARVLKLGRRLVYGVAESVAGDGALLAHHTLTYARPEPPSLGSRTRPEGSRARGGPAARATRPRRGGRGAAA